jgi:hypothetical protein
VPPGRQDSSKCGAERLAWQEDRPPRATHAPPSPPPPLARGRHGYPPRLMDSTGQARGEPANLPEMWRPVRQKTCSPYDQTGRTRAGRTSRAAGWGLGGTAPCRSGSEEHGGPGNSYYSARRVVPRTRVHDLTASIRLPALGVHLPDPDTARVAGPPAAHPGRRPGPRRGPVIRGRGQGPPADHGLCGPVSSCWAALRRTTRYRNPARCGSTGGSSQAHSASPRSNRNPNRRASRSAE